MMRPLPWRWILPALGLALYWGVMWLWTWPPHIDTNAEVPIEYSVPRPVQLVASFNAPAMVAAIAVSKALPDTETRKAIAWLIGLFLIPQWWAVGWWIDYLRGRQASGVLYRAPGRMVSDGALGFAAFSLLAGCWAILSPETDWRLVNLEAVIACILWPTFLIFAAWRLRADLLAEARRPKSASSGRDALP